MLTLIDTMVCVSFIIVYKVNHINLKQTGQPKELTRQYKMAITDWLQVPEREFSGQKTTSADV